MAIDEKVLDEILPVPDREELRDQLIQELRDEGFAITNFSSGGIFYTLLMIVIQIRIELVKLLRKVLNNMFISHAEGIWLELKAADFSKRRKLPTKAQGYVTLERDTPGEAIRIAKGNVFKTDQDINGEELRFLVVEDTVMSKNALSQKVLVIAEHEGAKYNVPPGQIKKSLTHNGGIDRIYNESDWLVQEGSDLEDIESFRERILNSWAELATMPIADKYKNVCEAVPGVLFVKVDDQHPRGQGTIDIIVTSTAGEATPTLLSLVEAEANKIKGPYDNILVKSSVTEEVDVNVIVSVEKGTNTEGLSERVKAVILSVMRISKNRMLNELLHSDLIFAIRRDIPSIVNVKVTLPEDDLVLEADKVIVPGEIGVIIQEV